MRVLKQCIFCGTKELHWGVVGSKGEEKWRLHDKDNNEHYCLGGVVAVLPPKSAAQIVDAVKKRWEHRLAAYDNEDYVKELEMLLILAVKDTLCILEGERGTLVDYVEGVEGRAIAFLNTVSPKE